MSASAVCAFSRCSMCCTTSLGQVGEGIESIPPPRSSAKASPASAASSAGSASPTTAITAGAVSTRDRCHAPSMSAEIVGRVRSSPVVGTPYG